VLNVIKSLSFLLMLLAGVFAYQRALEPDFIGIDFVQFHLTGRHVVNGGDPHVYSDKARHEILERAWKDATSEGADSKFFHAVNFRHERTWESYSSPFLYAMFGAVSEGNAGRKAPSSALPGTFSPEAGEKGRSENYERAINRYWIVCLGSTMIGFITFGWVLRIPGWSMLMGAVCLVWFSPLRIDMNVANVNQIQFGMVGVLAAILGGIVDRSLRRPELTSIVGIEKTKSRRRSDGVTARHMIAGVWLGLCLAFKPSLLCCGVMWLGPMVWVMCIKRKHHAERDESIWRPLVAAVVGGVFGGAIAVAFSAIWFPLHCWVEWIQAVGSLPDEIIQTEQGNYSPTYFARSYGVSGWLAKLAGPIMGVGLVVVMGRRIMSRENEMKRLTTGSTELNRTALESCPKDITNCVAIGCLIHLLTSNLVWYHYGLLSLPAMIVVLRDVVRSASWHDTMFLGGILLWCMLLIGLQPIDDWLASPPNEHFLRCLIGNLMLLSMVVIMPIERRLIVA
jgi:hypothetical protein